MKLDEIDIKLLNLLQENCMMPIKNLAQKINLSIAPTHDRIKKLEKQGLIKKYVALIDNTLVNKSLINYCNVSIYKHNTDKFAIFENAIRAMDEVLECYCIAGNSDYLLKIITSDMEEYQKFILTKLAKLDIISNINSQFVLKPIKYSTSINLKSVNKKEV